MPGLMSGLFYPAADDNASSTTTTVEGEGATGVEASPSVGVDMSGSYEDADRASPGWSNSTEVGTEVDLDAAVATSIELADDAA